MSECFITAKGHNGCNEETNMNSYDVEEVSLMHREFHEIRVKIYDLQDMLEQVINVLSGGTIDTFKTPINKTSTDEKPVLNPEKMGLGDNLTHLELMVGGAIQRVNEIYNIIGMDLNKRY